MTSFDSQNSSKLDTTELDAHWTEEEGKVQRREVISTKGSQEIWGTATTWIQISSHLAQDAFHHPMHPRL